MSTIHTLTSLLGDKLLLPSTEQYTKANSSYFTAWNNALQPAFIAQPTTTQEVSALIKALRPKLLNNECTLAIRGTGHTPFAAAANIDNGITLDLRGLTSLSLSPDKSLLTFGVGETWSSVYSHLEQHSLATAGGRVGRVGVGGLILGGTCGMAFQSTRRGFACDSVTDFEVVLADGSIVHANADANADLWVALKGGLNNFGIVTSMSMRTFSAGPIWGGLAYYAPESVPALMEACVEFVRDERDQDAHVMIGYGFGMGRDAGIACLFHMSGEEEPGSLRRFTGIEGLVREFASLRVGGQTGFSDELAAHSMGDGNRTFYATCTVRPDAQLMATIHALFREALDTIRDAEGLTFALNYHPLSVAMLQNSLATGGNAFDIPPSDGPLLILLVNPTWASTADDERVTNATKTLFQRIRTVAIEKGLLHRYIFPNYAMGEEDVLAGYGEESLKRLREVRKRVDPEGLWQRGVPGGFKLGMGE
ncbi:FAD-binding domain-containing protein [Polyplosphaeria fusca]|uniref:FAD-binding domain-containing protein n=1 Tax=Polyplosphaeria fusca TaxID=682080 RepID=A0A9P4QQX3_9PLEO|nr:FAD-binding domain-containing protein [Polyplosphaeria fusca]